MSNSMLRAIALRKALPTAYSNIPFELLDSFESAEIALLSNQSTGNIDSLTDLAAQIDKGNEIVAQGMETASGLENLVDKSLAVYGESGITEQGAALLRVSVESYLMVRGIDIPVQMIVPSFESGKTHIQYSAEVAEAKSGILKKIFAWLYTAMKTVMDALKNYFVKVDTNAKEVSAFIEQVKTRVNAVTGEVKHSDAKINLATSAIWLTDRHDRIATPSKQIVDTVARFEDFVVEWGFMWSGLTTLDIPTEHKTSAQVHATSEKIKGLALKASGNAAKAKIDFVATHQLELKEGTGSLPLLGSTVKIDPAVVAKEHQAPILTKQEMVEGIADAASAMKVLDKLKVEVDRMAKMTKRIEDLSRNVSLDDGDESSVAELRDAFKVLNKACWIASWGWTNTTPYFLKTIKACVGYIDASTRHYGTKG